MKKHYPDLSRLKSLCICFLVDLSLKHLVFQKQVSIMPDDNTCLSYSVSLHPFGLLFIKLSMHDLSLNLNLSVKKIKVAVHVVSIIN